MATVQELHDALRDFAERYAAEPRLKVMNRDWDRVIHVAPTDLAGGDFTLTLKDGDLSLQKGAPEHAHMVVRADSETLTDLFYGDISPTEPYMDGRLRIEASEEDTMRLDVITLMIWGE
ncbi:MAG: SCP2 sterol-binding domain-containing protein [Clostridia bacterium]|nr:SCP2 sterol-binding domain-containing protein [Clostridia bacterium]